MRQMAPLERRRPRRCSLRALLSRLIASATIALIGVLLLPGAQVLAAEPAGPVIESTSVVDITEHGATVQARIDPRGLETAYELRLVWQDPDAHPARGEPLPGGVQVQTGSIAAGYGPQTVSFQLTDLQPGNTYWYELGALNSAGHTEGQSPYQFAFHSRREYPEGEGNPPYEGEMPLLERWFVNLSEEESAQTLAEYEARHARELQAQRAGEAEQQRAREAAEGAEAAAAKHRSEEEASLSASPAISLTDTMLRVRSGRTVFVRLECLGKDACHGNLTITARSRAKKAHPASDSRPRELALARRVTIGAAAFSIAGYEAKTARINLNPTGRSLLSAGHGRLSPILEILELAPGPSSTQMTAVHLIRERPHG